MKYWNRVGKRNIPQHIYRSSHFFKVVLYLFSKHKQDNFIMTVITKICERQPQPWGSATYFSCPNTYKVFPQEPCQTQRGRLHQIFTTLSQGSTKGFYNLTNSWFFPRYLETQTLSFSQRYLKTCQLVPHSGITHQRVKQV